MAGLVHEVNAGPARHVVESVEKAGGGGGERNQCGEYETRGPFLVPRQIGHQCASLSETQAVSFSVWQSRHALGLSFCPNRAVIPASGRSSIWWERASNMTLFMMRGM